MSATMILRPICKELVKVLSELPRPSLLQRPCQRCLTGGQHRLRYSVHAGTFPHQRRGASFSLAGSDGPSVSLRLHLGPSCEQKRGLSDSRDDQPTEENNTALEGCESLDTASKRSDDLKGSEAVDEGRSWLSERSQTETEETATAGERVENVQEADAQSSESFTGGGNGFMSGNALALGDPDEEDGADHLDNQIQIDILAEQTSPTVLEEFIQPLLPTESLSLAAYADHSPTLQKLVDLGVDLSKVEQKEGIGNQLIKMDFDRHIKDKIVFLHRAGVQSREALARFLTINPFVLTEELENLETRLEYLKSKRFSDEAIAQVLTRAPYFINFSVDRVDSKLGFFQKELSLSGDEIRHMITKMPKLVTSKIQRVKENVFVLRKQLGFTTFELKKLILAEPKLLLRGKEKLIGIFDYLHNHMGIPHKQLLESPQVFNGRVFVLQERHQFLKNRGRAQYDPRQPNYVAVERLVKLPDEVFCQDIAKSSLQEYNAFLKTL